MWQQLFDEVSQRGAHHAAGEYPAPTSTAGDAAVAIDWPQYRGRENGSSACPVSTPSPPRSARSGLPLTVTSSRARSVTTSRGLYRCLRPRAPEVGPGSRFVSLASLNSFPVYCPPPWRGPHSESVSAALSEILREDMNVDISRVTRESRLIDDVGLDSVAFAVGMVAIEDKLGVALTEEDLLSCDTAGELEDAILAKVPAAPSNS